MNIQIRFLPVVLALLLLVAPAYAVVIGDWEGEPSDCNDWGNRKSIDDPCNMPSKYEYASLGATRGTQSLHLKQTGMDQNLAIHLNYDRRVEFMANNQFMIDITVPADSLGYGGYCEIYNVVLNAEGYGWNDQFASPPLFFGFWDGSPERTATLMIDYSAAKESMPEIPGYVEFVFTTQSDPNRGDFYFDNAQILFGPSELYNDTVMADSPVLYLKFDELAPADSSGNNYWVGYGGTIMLSGDSIGGGSIYLNGSGAGGYAAAANQTTAPSTWPLEYGDEFAFAPDDTTFEFWTKIEAMADGATFFHQVGNWEDEPYAPGFGHWQGDLRVFTGHRTGAYNMWHPGVATPTFDDWHHFVVTYDEAYGGDPNVMQIQLYLDGNFSGSTILGDISAPARLGAELNHLVIGGINNAGGVYNTVTGKFDEFAIYAGVLGSDRVASHYASGVYDRDHATKTCADIWEKGLGLVGDADKDCDVDMDDLTLLIHGWLLCNDPNITDPDWNPDCVISW